MIHLTEENFEQEVLKSDIPVFVDFWAEWCGPCKMFAPVVDELDKEFSDRVKICKLDVDKAPQISSKYGIFSIPTVILFKNGKPVEKLIGVQSKKIIKELLEKILST